MKQTNVFAIRNAKEFLRDPLSYVFCLGFPVVMLVVMTIVNNSIPAEAGMDIFGIKKLSAGIAMFGFTFTMLFTALQISKDRGSSFLIRLYSTPMKSVNFICGYIIPMLVIGIAQAVVTFVFAYIIGKIQGITFNVINMLLAVLILIIPILLFVSFGLLFGSLFSDKVAPGLCSIIISLSSMLGGVFMDVEQLGGTLYRICNVLPFYQCVKAGRAAILGNYIDIWKPLLIVLVYTCILFLISVFAFGRKMKADLN